MDTDLRAEYRARINRVLDYIENHLGDQLTLEGLAREANFSPYHFHRIFRAMVGEPLNKFIQRVRLERAATQLVFQPRKSITDIALDHGFASSATFARAFREAYGMSAGAWRSGGFRERSKFGKVDGKTGNTDGNDGKAPGYTIEYLAGVFHHQKYTIMKDQTAIAQVEVKALPAMHVAYVRHVGPYQGDSALFGRLFGKIMKWAGPRGLVRFPETQMVSIYHDNPDLTEDDKLRVSVGITVPEGTAVDGEVGLMTLPATTYAIGHFEIDPSGYEQAWNAIFSGWLPDSGYQPDDSPSFERYLNDPETHPEKKHIVDICVPVKPL